MPTIFTNCQKNTKFIFRFLSDKFCGKYLPTKKSTNESPGSHSKFYKIPNYIFIIPKFQKTQQREYEVINQEIGI